MRPQCSVASRAMAIFIASISPIPLAAQGLSIPAKAGKAISASKSGTVTRIANGQPDLEGVWSSSTLTPLERPTELAGKQVLTEQEATDYVKRLLQQVNTDRRDGGAQVDVGRSYNEFWRDRGNDLVADRRTSLIVDPPDGRIPPLTPAAQKAVQERRDWVQQHPADGPESFGVWERCITRGLPMVPGPYNNDLQIVQTAGNVTILNEMIHDARIIPLDGMPHVSPAIREWSGDARGHWEGNTLVVDTTNFTGEYSFHGSDANLHLTERFARVSRDVIEYEFTIDDPTAFTKPWTARVPLNKSHSQVFEYACHEGNYALADILAGARAAEKKK